eukprot:CAMPEP_0201656390 /NCGR_PEP_ID=MMETSP0493-20130528/46500_1 /ASSEMBLY_ACC=CAM_ASM_000838 /TAXON_ID=420259 /ORGANISM="Thalassiosira gravida, Strain GMp14c1" /LENGTH=105 /DNA_ID=CAMNT_0048133001 /DNA_START=336 /DNA_END=654 /DNA_ORIENTATION=-
MATYAEQLIMVLDPEGVLDLIASRKRKQDQPKHETDDTKKRARICRHEGCEAASLMEEFVIGIELDLYVAKLKGAPIMPLVEDCAGSMDRTVPSDPRNGVKDTPN